ncbi:MAG: hypothetical protein U5L46_11645 [Agrobacterium sp.]|nr:hypothetical protein [Agrobacterium sp.]
MITEIFGTGFKREKTGKAVAKFQLLKTNVAAGESAAVKSSVQIKNPKLWGPAPTQTPNLYIAVIQHFAQKLGKQLMHHETEQHPTC